MMKDWECLTDVLLEEPGKGKKVLDDRHETSLIEIMVCCVKQAATSESPVGRGPNRRLTAKASRQAMEDKTKLTEHFITSLPLLLRKYLMDPEKVANLLHIPLYFDLNIYIGKRQKKLLKLLLGYLHEIADKHTDAEVLEALSKCYECLCNEEHAISGKCDFARSKLIDGLVVKYKEAKQDYFAEGDHQPNETFALLASLNGLYYFYSCHDLGGWNLYDDLFHIVRTGYKTSSVPEEILCKGIATCSCAIRWHLNKLDENSPDKDDMKALKKRLHKLLRYCHNLMCHPQEKVTEEAYITICDLLIVFSKNLGQNAMKPLIYEPDQNLQSRLISFLTEKVFVEEEGDDVDENVKIEELHQRRNFLESFCKLVVYNIISIEMAAVMFKHYMKYYNDYGDIFKATLSKAQEINKIATAKTLALSLMQLFREVQMDEGTVDRSSDPFQSIKKLARLFSLSFGLDRIKNREAVVALHKECIMFSLKPNDEHGSPPNMAFLEILSEFCNNLTKKDKNTVVNYLDMHVSALGEVWLLLLTLGSHYHVDETGNDTWSDASTPGPPSVQPQTSTAVKRRRVDDDMESSDSEHDFEDSHSPKRKAQSPAGMAAKRTKKESSSADSSSSSDDAAPKKGNKSTATKRPLDKGDSVKSSAKIPRVNGPTSKKAIAKNDSSSSGSESDSESSDNEDTKTNAVKKLTKVQPTSSGTSDSDEDSSDEDASKRKKVPVKANAAKVTMVKSMKIKAVSSSSSNSDSSSEDKAKLIKKSSVKTPVVPINITPNSVARVKSAAESSSSSDSDSSSEDEKAKPTKTIPGKKSVSPLKSAPRAVTKKAESSTSSSEEDKAKLSKKTPVKASVLPARNTPKTPVSTKKNASSSSSDSDSSSEEDKSMVIKKTPIKTPVRNKFTPKGATSSSESDSSSEEETPQKIEKSTTVQNKNTPKATLKSPTVQPKHTPKSTPVTKKPASSSSSYSDSSSEDEKTKNTPKSTLKSPVVQTKNTPKSTPVTKKPVSSSDSDSSSEDDKPKNTHKSTLKSPAVQIKNTPKSTPVTKKPASSSSSYSDSSSEDEKTKNTPKSSLKPPAVQVTNTPKSTPATNKPNSSSSSDSDSSSEDENPKSISKSPAQIKTTPKPAAPAKKAESSSSSSDSDSSSEDEKPKNTHRSTLKSPAVQIKNTPKSTPVTKKPASSSSSDSESSSDDEKSQTPKKAATKQTTKVNTNSKDSSSDSDSSSDDESKTKTESPAPIINNGASKKNSKKTGNTPFRRVKPEEMEVDSRFGDNSFEAKSGSRSWGDKANKDLKHTKGKSFRHEKTKKKRGS